RAYEFGEHAPVGYVHLVQGDQARPVGEPPVLGQLVLDRVDVALRIATGFERRAVHHVQQDRTALDVPQEAEAEPLAGRGARDEPRYVGHRERLVVDAYDTEVRYERREGEAGDLRPGRGQYRD